MSFDRFILNSILGAPLRRSMALAGLFAILAVSFTAHSGGTRIWELAGFTELDKGELKQTTVSSRGEVTVGAMATGLDLDDVGLVWSAVEGKAGVIYLGTGYDGKIFRVKGGKATLIATTGQLVVTSLALDKRGDLYAAALPDAVILKIPKPSKIATGKPVKASKWATLPGDVKHVWALAFKDKGKTLYAGTGPEGQVFAVGPDAKASVYMDTDEEHVMCLVDAGVNRLLAGTSPGALLLEITGPGRSSALADFDATEVKAIVYRKGDIVAAVNKFQTPPAIPTKPKTSTPSIGTIISKLTTTKPSRAGDGELYRLHENGAMEKLWTRKKAHVVSLAVDGKNRIHAGLATGGKIVSVDEDRLTRTELDLDERQVMVLLTRGDELVFAATGDAGAAYTISAPRPSEARYLSPPLDAGTIALWGRLRWFGHGKLRVQSRSGNTLAPDMSWSDWSKALKNGGAVPSKRARYLQLRFSFEKDKNAVLRSAELSFAPINRRAVITEVNPDSPFFKVGKTSTSKITKKDILEPSKRTIVARVESKKKRADLKLNWKVDNPDKDKLRYRLWYRAVGRKVWRPILKDDFVLTVNSYNWNTESVPEGRYQIKLVADDSPSNDPSKVLSDKYISVPVLVDNHQPAVDALGFAGGKVKGKARDSFSAISALDFSVDGGPWMPIFCADGIFDEVVEEFDFALTEKLEPGPHAIAVRAYDRAGNMGSAEIHVETK